MADDEVVFRLVLKNIPPAEAARLASQTAQSIEAELKASLERQTAAHKKAAEATTKEAQKAAAAEVKAAQSATKAVIQAQKEIEAAAKRTAQEQEKAYRAAEREAKKASQAVSIHWRRTMEDIENITVAVQGAWGALQVALGGLGKLKALGDEVIRTSAIFGSLEGSIDEARKAVNGTVTDMDLIIAKNRMLELELGLTDKQFATVAASADTFANKIGVDSGQALDKLIQGLASANERLLKQSGIVLDVDTAHQKMARSIGKTVDQLTDEEKRIAFVNAALVKMDEKLTAAGDQTKTFGQELQQTFVDSKNIWDRTLAKIGNMPSLELMLGGREGIEDENEGTTGPDQLARVKAKNARLNARYDARAKARMDATLSAATGVGAGSLEANGGDLEAGYNDYDPSKRFGTDITKYAAIGGSDTKTKKTKQDELAALIRADRLRLEAEANAAERAYNDALELTGPADEWAAERESIYAATESDAEEASLAEQIEAQQKYFASLNRTREETQAFLAETNAALATQAGELGFYGRLLFGEGGPEKLYAQMDESEKATVDAVRMVQDATGAMAGAFGEAYAAWAAGEKGFKQAMLEQTKAVVRNLAVQAVMKAAFHAASALGDLAFGNFPGAATHAIAAAKFGALAAGAGLLLGPLGGATASANSKADVGQQPTSLRPDRPREQRQSGPASAPTIHVHVFPGGEAEAGRSVVNALKAYEAQTGRRVMGVAA